MATSITNTSITTDNLTVDTDTIHVDSANNKVGIGTTSPSYTLHSTTSSGSDFAGFFHNSAGSGNGTALIAKGGANNSGAGTFIVQDYGGNEDFKVDGLGRVTMPNQPSWFGTHADNYATTWSGGQVFNMIANTANSYNVGNHFDFSTERFTAPVAGHYLVFGWDIRENGTEATGVGLGVYKNGLGSSNRVVNSYHQNQRGYAFSSVISLAVNDWISFGVTEGGGVSGLFYGSGSYSGYGIRLLG